MTRHVSRLGLFTVAAVCALVLAGAPAPAHAQVFPGVNVSLIDHLDNDNDGVISCGDTLVFRARLASDPTVPAPFPVQDGMFTGVVLLDGALEIGSVTARSEHPAGGPVTIVEGNSPGDEWVRVDLGTVCPPGEICPGTGGLLDGATVEWAVRIREPNFSQVYTQIGYAFGSNYAGRSHRISIPFEPCDPPPGPPVDPAIVATKTDAQLIDLDGDGRVDPGESIRYTVDVVDANGAADDVVFVTGVDPNTTLHVGSVTTTRGVVQTGNDPGDTSVEVLLGDLGSDAETITFDVDVAGTVPAGVSEVVCQGTASGSNFDDVLTDDPATPPRPDPTVTPLDFDPDLALTKDDGGVAAEPGVPLVYTLTFDNLSLREPASGVQLAETVPVNTVFRAGPSSPGWSCADGAPAGTDCGLSIGSVPAGGGGSVTFAVEPDPGLPPGTPSLVNTATVSDDGTHGPDTNPANNSDTETTPILIPTEVDLAIVKDDGGAVADPGAVVTYQLEVDNLGTSRVAGVEVTDAVPPETTFDATGSSPGWSCADGAPPGTPCVAGIGEMVPGESASLILAVRVGTALPPGFDLVTNTATVTDNGQGGPDVDPSNNTSTDTTPLNPQATAPDLFVDKDDGGVVAEPGDVVVYDLELGNLGTQGATGVELADNVPRHTVFDTAGSSPGWTCADGDPEGTVCTLGLGTLLVGDDGTAAFAVRVLPTLPPAVEQITNTAVIGDDGANGDDLNPADNFSTDTTPLGETTAPDLFVDKDDGGVVVDPGDVVVYTLSFGNEGVQGATGVELADTVPDHAVFDAAGSSADWSCADGSPTGTPCTLVLGELAVGDTGSVEFALRVLEDLPAGVDQLTNTAGISDDGTNGPDLNPLDNLSTDTTPISKVPPTGPGPLEVFKQDIPDRLPAQPRDAITYTVVIQNLIDGTTANTVFESGAPEYTSLVVGTVTTTHGVVTRGNDPGDLGVTVDVGDLPAGHEAVVTFQVEIDELVPAGVTEIVCQGTVTADGIDPEPTDDPDTAADDDPTRTPLAGTGGPHPIEIPAAGPLGLLLLAVLLGLFAVWRLRSTATA